MIHAVAMIQLFGSSIILNKIEDRTIITHDQLVSL